MTTVAIADGLYDWTLTLADGTTRTVLGSGIDTVVSGNFPSPVVSVTRGTPFPNGTPIPVLTLLTPATAAISAPDFTLHVTGTAFRPGCQILWDGNPMVTTIVSPTEVTALIHVGAPPRTIPVTVRSIDGSDSNALSFALTATGQEEPA